MKFLLDSCVAIKWIIPEQDSENAHRILSSFGDGSIDLVVPDIFPVEVAHAVTRAERASRLLPSEGVAGVEALLAVLPDLFPSVDLLPRAYELSSQLRIGVYDCLYVALSEQEQCPLITADMRLMAALPSLPILLLANF